MLNIDEFDNEIGSAPGVVLVDFYADWCMPCKMVAPLLEEIARENENVKVFKVNIDENPSLAQTYDVKSIPNFVSFKNGKMYKRMLGMQPKERLLDLIN